MHKTTMTHTNELVVEHRWLPGDRVTNYRGSVYVIGDIDIIDGVPCYRVQTEETEPEMPLRASVGDTVEYWDEPTWQPASTKTWWYVAAASPKWAIAVQAATEAEAIDEAHESALRLFQKGTLSARRIEFVD